MPNDQESATEELLSKAGAGEIPDCRWPAELLRMVVTLTDTWQRAGVDLDEAVKRAREGVSAIAWSQGGRPVYLPTGESLKRAIRDASIWAEYHYRPGDIQVLREKHGLKTDRAVYAIIAKQRKFWRDKVRRLTPG